jgi:Flp pilus assembly protein TadG
MTRDRGAALVEFAVLAPLLLVLLLGIVEFGWLFAQFNEVRHSAQEGARWGAVSRPDVDGAAGLNWGDMAARACNAANLPAGTTISIDATLPPGGTKGDTASITVTANVQSLTGVPIISSFIPSQLTNTATFRLEQDATWSPTPTNC